MVVFNGVSYMSVGGAGLSGGNMLVVEDDGASASGTYGARVGLGQGVSTASFQAMPVDLPEGAGWGLKLFGVVDGARSRVALAWNEAIDDSTHQILFDYLPDVGATSVTMEYYLDGDLLFSVPGVPLLSSAQGTRTAASAGQSKGTPGSVHVIRDGSVYIVATDYGGGEPRIGQTADAEGGCSGAIVETGFPGVPAQFCTDYIQAVPDTFSIQGPATDLEIRGRVPLDEFTLISGTLQ